MGHPEELIVGERERCILMRSLEAHIERLDALRLEIERLEEELEGKPDSVVPVAYAEQLAAVALFLGCPPLEVCDTLRAAFQSSDKCNAVLATVRANRDAVLADYDDLKAKHGAERYESREMYKRACADRDAAAAERDALREEIGNDRAELLRTREVLKRLEALVSELWP